MYGIVGRQRPDQTEEQAKRDTFVRDTLLTLAEGNTDSLWAPVTTQPNTQGIGDQPTDPTAHAVDVLRIFDGIDRP
jgi:para-nitrobenzyl esterase